MEVLALIQGSYSFRELAFYDEIPRGLDSLNRFQILKTKDEVREKFQSNPEFCLGIGNPSLREKFDREFTDLGGELTPILAQSSVIQSEAKFADVLSFGFIGPKVNLGRGVLVNTRASIHHECEIGEYSEIGPGAILLGKVKIGKKCRIGAGAVILPGITLGDEVVVGAGAVVTANMESSVVVAGVPAKKINQG